MLKEFKEFAFGGNLIDIAVAFVMGTAFAALISALVTYIVMPLVGAIFGKPSFDDVFKFTANDSIVSIGSFLTALMVFLATAFGLFMFVVKPYKAYKARQKTGGAPVPEPSEDIQLLRKIADGLARR